MRRQITTATWLMGIAWVVSCLGMTVKSFADDAACSIEETQAILKAQTVLKRAALEIPDSAIGAGGALASDAKLADHIRNLSHQLMESYALKKIPKDSKVLRLIRWSSLASYARSTFKKIRTPARLGGVGLVIAQFAAVAAEFLVPVAMVSMGHPEWIPISACTPYAVVAHGIHYTVSRLNHRSNVASVYGSMESYLETLKAERLARKELGLHAPTDWLVPIEVEEGKFLNAVVSKSNFIKDRLRRWGWNSQTLTFDALDQFSQSKNLDDDFILDLRKDSHLPSQLKTVLLLQHLADRNLGGVIFEIQEKFSASFSEIKTITDDNEVREWALNATKIEDPEDLKRMIERAPKNANPRQIYALWNEVVLPILAEKDFKYGFGYYDFRRLIKNSEKLKMFSGRYSVWNPEWVEIFKNYIDVSVLKYECRKLLSPLWF